MNNNSIETIKNLVNSKLAKEAEKKNKDKMRTLILRDNAIAEWHRLLPELQEGMQLLKEIGDIHHRISETNFSTSNFTSRTVFCPGYGVMANHYRRQDEIFFGGITYSISDDSFDYCGRHTITKTTENAEIVKAFYEFVQFLKRSWEELLKEAETKIKEEADKYLAN